MKLSAEKQNSLINIYLSIPGDLKLPSGASEIDDFLAIASDNKAAANLYLQIKKANLSLPDTIMKPLAETYQKILAKNTRRLQVGLPILLQMKNAGIDVIILKGNAIAEEIFGDIGYKPMNDIDILVKPTDLDAIHAMFMKNNLLTAAPLEENIRKQEKYSHHWPPFFDKKLDLFLGTHWNVAAPSRGLSIPIEDFWRDKEEFKLMGETFYRLSPMHFVLHLCIHLNSAKTGLREIGDIVKLIEARQSDLSASDFVDRVKNAKAEYEVYEALALTLALKKSAFTDAVVLALSEIIQDEKFKAKVLKRMTPRHKLLHIRTNYISKIEKTFALFMLTEAPLEKTLLLARMWKLYLFVPGTTALKLNYEFSDDAGLAKRFMASLFAPIKISQVFINDLGPLIFIIVTLRHQWVLLDSYFNFLFKKFTGKPIKSLDSIARGMGLSFSEIKEISALD
ncbi:MAG: nucleotidyltransferase family protein [Bacteriovorax sp.]|jgi:hypothetical protein